MDRSARARTADPVATVRWTRSSLGWSGIASPHSAAAVTWLTTALDGAVKRTAAMRTGNSWRTARGT